MFGWLKPKDSLITERMITETILRMATSGGISPGHYSIEIPNSFLELSLNDFEYFVVRAAINQSNKNAGDVKFYVAPGGITLSCGAYKLSCFLLPLEYSERHLLYFYLVKDTAQEPYVADQWDKSQMDPAREFESKPLVINRLAQIVAEQEKNHHMTRTAEDVSAAPIDKVWVMADWVSSANLTAGKWYEVVWEHPEKDSGHIVFDNGKKWFILYHGCGFLKKGGSWNVKRQAERPEDVKPIVGDAKAEDIPIVVPLIKLNKKQFSDYLDGKPISEFLAEKTEAKKVSKNPPVFKTEGGEEFSIQGVKRIKPKKAAKKATKKPAKKATGRSK